MKLPNGDKAIVPMEKLTRYCLDFESVDGKHKARMFRNKLGLIKTDALILRDTLLKVARENDALHIKTNKFGEYYTIAFKLSFNNKTATVLSAWFINNDTIIPRLITCYIKEL